jgi:hypothetical protein
VHNEQISVDRRFGIYFELDDASDGGMLIVPRDEVVDPELVDGFADLEVVVQDYNPGPLPQELTEPPPTGTFETEDRQYLSYWIVPGDSRLWWLAVTDEGFLLIPESVVPFPGAVG